MDRREALQKLAVGGAVAVGGSQVLTSNAVAQTLSGNVPENIPPPGQPLQPIVSPTGSPVRVDISAPDLGVCFQGPSTPTTTYRWSIVSYTIGALFESFAQLRLLDQPGGVLISRPVGDVSCSVDCGGPVFSSGPTIRIERRSILPIFGTIVTSLQQGDEVVLDLEVVTQCAGGPEIVAEYRWDSTNGLDSPMENLSYYVDGVSQLP